MENQVETKKILLVNQLKELETISQYLEELAGGWDLSVPFTMKLTLALEEAFTNIVNYGFRDDESHEIALVFEKQNNRLFISLIDDGIPYDPTLTTDPDINLSAEERKIGGLGIFLIRKMMDKVSYQRIGKNNVLKMEKTITPN
ncbi:MAG: ATP-binding protein [Bacteroidetes bacterium]|jgi:serine/threonine-protein kinase RsbW|nr:ATP-binding protein [Bacteroidota bacterium]